MWKCKKTKEQLSAIKTAKKNMGLMYTAKTCKTCVYYYHSFGGIGGPTSNCGLNKQLIIDVMPSFVCNNYEFKHVPKIERIHREIDTKKINLAIDIQNIITREFYKFAKEYPNWSDDKEWDFANNGSAECRFIFPAKASALRIISDYYITNKTQ